ncbi:MAG: ChbG/HpnK family deacetylase [Candidatus Peribacteraceae bacterium]|jgi:predicted glycoside hydrolase/deacetylase ChbG (UPF0249 family)
MPRLIITADDLGVNAQRSHGIFLCAEFGAVTAASLWPNGSDSDAAAKRSRERGLPVGLHVNLTEEYPLSKPGDVASLLDMTGRFHPVQRLFTLLDEGKVQQEHLEREIRAQISWALESGLTLTHVSGNWDAHVHPAVAAALIPAMERYGLRLVRIPCEEPLPPFGFNVPEEQLAATRAINAMAKKARKLFEAAGIASTDHFRGHTLLDNASAKNLRHVISRLPEGTTELMVHPGSPCAYGTPFDLDPQRQTELRMLTDESFKAFLVERKVELIGWGDL